MASLSNYIDSPTRSPISFNRTPSPPSRTPSPQDDIEDRVTALMHRQELNVYPVESLTNMYKHGVALTRCIEQLSDQNIVTEVLNGADDNIGFESYPRIQNGIRTNNTTAYYHAHRENEHGHFHIFQNPPGGVEVLDYSTINGTDPMFHLGGISMNRSGEPIKLFTLNGCNTRDLWYPADTIPEFIHELDIKNHSAAGAWVTHCVKLFMPEFFIINAVREKLVAKEMETSGKDFLLDMSVEELSSAPASISLQMRAIEKALEQKGRYITN